MAYLRNPSFENDINNWTFGPAGSDASFQSIPLFGIAPISGSNVGFLQSYNPNAFVSQEATVDAPSVVCIAYVATTTGNVPGTLTIAIKGSQTKSVIPFSIASTYQWQQITGTLDLNGPAQVVVEFKMLVGQVNSLVFDFVNLF